MKIIIIPGIIFFIGATSAAWSSGVIEDGVCLTYDREGIHLFENYQDLAREGVLLQYFNNGGVEKIFQYHADQLQRMAVGYYPNQQVQYRIHFVNGIKNGSAQRFYDNGHLAVEMTYRGGKLDGIAKFYNHAGVME